MGSGPSCFSKVKEVGLGLLMYANDNNDQFPPNLSNQTVLRNVCVTYVRSDAVLIPPEHAVGAIVANGLLSGMKSSELPDPAGTVLDYYTRPWLTYGVVCYADGHAKSLSSFESLLQQLTRDPMADTKGSGG